jgi:hypothetical protein
LPVSPNARPARPNCFTGGCILLTVIQVGDGYQGGVNMKWPQDAIRIVRDRKLLAGLIFILVLSSVSVLFFRHWLWSLSLTKDQAAFWDVAFKGIGGVVAVGGAWLALSKYFDERAKTNQTALIEATKPFFSKRQEVYYQLVSATASIGNRGRDEPQRREAEAQFWWLFWGVVPMVLDDQVAVAVNAFSVALDEDPENGVRLRNASMNLARACRMSLGFIEHDRASGVITPV